MPTARNDLGAAGLNGMLYAVGGKTGNTCTGLSTLEAYDAVADTWTTKASMPTGRFNPAAVALNGVLYVVGGDVGCAVRSAAVEAYDPVSNSWSPKAAMPNARTSFAAGVINGLLYAVGGVAGNTVVATVEAYDPASNTWTTKAPMPTARCCMTAGVVNDILYVVGGQDVNGVNLTTVEAYHPATNTWTAKAPMPTARTGVHGAVLNGLLYAIGGSNATGPVYTLVEVYDPTTNTWSSGPAMPPSRTRLGVGVTNDNLFAVGGSGPGGIGDESVLGTNEAFTPGPAPTTLTLSDQGWMGDLTFDGTLLYMPQMAGPRPIVKIDPVTGAVVGVLNQNPFVTAGPRGAAFDGAGHLFLTSMSPSVCEFELSADLANRTNCFTVADPNPNATDDFRTGALAFDGTHLYIGDTDAGTIVVTDRLGNGIRDFESGHRPEGMAFDPLTGHLWLLDLFIENRVSEMTTSGQTVRSCDVPYKPGAFGFGGIAIVGSKFYLADPLNSNDPNVGTTIHIVDRSSLTCDPPLVVPVVIDIQPGSDPNNINPRNGGTILVAVLSSASFNAPARLDRRSLTFGRTGHEASLAFCNRGTEDVNADGFPDLACHFYTQETGFQSGDREGVLRGNTLDGMPVEGRDAVGFVLPAARVRLCSGDPTAFQTFDLAMAAVAPGGTVEICDGTHTVDSVSVGKPLTFQPERGAHPVLQTTTARAGFIVEGVASGVVTFRALAFHNVSPRDPAAGKNTYSIRVRDAYDQVVIRSSTFSSAADATGGVLATQSTTANARLLVQNSRFSGGFVGVNAASAPRVDIVRSEFNGHSFNTVLLQGTIGSVENSSFSDCGSRGCVRATAGSQVDVLGSQFADATAGVDPDFHHIVLYVGAAAGRIENNVFNGCGVGVCILAVDRASVEVVANQITVVKEHGTTAAIGGSDGTAGSQPNFAERAPTMFVADNVITGFGGSAATEPWNPAAYAFDTGIFVENAAVAKVFRNRITNAINGIVARGPSSADPNTPPGADGGVFAEGSDNMVDRVLTAVRVFNSSVANIRSSDFTNYQVAIDFGGNDEPSDLTCNWWGTVLGPQNVHAGVDTGVYTPWATGPVAGQSATSCNADHVGTYTLQTVNGSTLPVVIVKNDNSTFTITAGSITLNQDNTLSLTVETPESGETFSGMYSVTGSTFAAVIPQQGTIEGGPVNLTGTVTTNRLTFTGLTDRGESFVFQK